MSIWSDDPEWFDEWLEKQALKGRFGPRFQFEAEQGNFEASEQWTKLDVDGKLRQEAMSDYCERFVH
jgi:hypothetical protein